MVVLLPVVVGQVAHRLFWSRLRHLHAGIVRLSQAIILVFVYTGVAVAAIRLPSGRR